jgi:secreted Zn-dependent insulinase-like peptidase
MVLAFHASIERPPGANVCRHPDKPRSNLLHHLQGQTKEKEYFYGAEFSREAVPEDWRRRWRERQFNVALHLPAANPFISTDFAMQEVHGW